MAYRGAPLNPVLRLIYLLLRLLAWAGVSVFYRKRIILGRENLKFDGPAIIVANHPSTLMDVLNTCLHIRQESFFLANYGLFKNPVSNWLLTRLYCIPVKRREDVAAGEARNNDAAFEQSFKHLEKNGLLFIAAEGVSWMDRQVRPFKTGAARIAFGAESRNDWKLGVKILPIGLSYSAPNLFRSEVIVHFGEPLHAAEWFEAFEKDPEQAIDAYTEAARTKVRSLVLEVPDLEKQHYIGRLETVMQSSFPKDGEEMFRFRKNLIEQHIGDQRLESKLEKYFRALKQYGLTDAGLRSKPSIGQLLFLILTAPLFLIGYAVWWLPCYLPWLLTRKMKLYIGYDSNVKTLAGLFTFPLALWGLFEAVKHLAGKEYAWPALLIAVLLGYFTEKYMDVARIWRRRSKAERLRKSDPQAFEELLRLQYP